MLPTFSLKLYGGGGDCMDRYFVEWAAQGLTCDGWLSYAESEAMVHTD